MGVEGPIDLLYIDGAHRYGPAKLDIDAGRARGAGGTLLIHDSFSSILTGDPRLASRYSRSGATSDGPSR